MRRTAVRALGVSAALVTACLLPAASAQAYVFDGFLPPLVNPPATNQTWAGAVVPLRFSLGQDEGLQILAAGSPTVRWTDCTTRTLMPGVAAVPAKGGLTYDPATTRYTFAWQTARAWGGTCQRLTMNLADGTSHRILFKLTWASSRNLLVNPGFETAVGGLPRDWMASTYSGTSSLLRVTGVKRSGAASAKIVAATPDDASWSQVVPVLPNSVYRLSGWVRATAVAHTSDLTDTGATLGIGGTWARSPGVFGTTGWTWVSMVVASRDATELTVSARLGFWAGTTTGTAWFDDLKLEQLRPRADVPAWKFLVLIYPTTDVTFTDSTGTHHVVAKMTAAERQSAAAAARAYVRTDLPALTSGMMVPTVTVRFPSRALPVSSFAGGFWPSPDDTAPERDQGFDAVIVIWDPTGADPSTGQEYRLNGGFAGLTPNAGYAQTYATLILDAATSYGHRNVFKHEFGHSLAGFHDATGVAPYPVVTNEPPSGTYYVHCGTGQPYVWQDETLANPIPNSIYSNGTGFTHDFFSGTTALATDPRRCLGATERAWSYGGPVTLRGAPS